MLLQGDARSLPLTDESVQCVVTSPPYWGLRAYAGEQRGVWGGEAGHAHEWGDETRIGGGKQNAAGQRWQHTGGGVSGHGSAASGRCPCGAWYGALGLEPTPELYVEHMVAVFREVRRVLRPDGTLWLNLGDSYAAGHGGSSTENGGVTLRQASRTEAQPRSRAEVDVASWSDRDHTPRNVTPGLKPKDLLMMPHRVALALQADGWWVRSDIVWSKPNPMPESVTDRPTKAHEYLFLMSKSPRYFYDADAIREPHTAGHLQRDLAPVKDRGDQRQFGKHGLHDFLNPLGRNARTVWTIATQSYPGAHFATYPEKLVEPCILAGSSAKACGVCAAPWARVTERTGHENKREPAHVPNNSATKTDSTGWAPLTRSTGAWRSTCEHDDDSGSCVVLDPFAGSGTTLRVATRLGRQAVGVDISREYLVEQAMKRTTDIQIGLEAVGL